jgi:N-methylhydantoinase B
MNILENLSVVEGRYRCDGCGKDIGSVEENYKVHVNYRSKPVQELGDLFVDPRKFVDDDIVIREFVCPGCGVLFDSEISRLSEPPTWDIQLNVGPLATGG